MCRYCTIRHQTEWEVPRWELGRRFNWEGWDGVTSATGSVDGEWTKSVKINHNHTRQLWLGDVDVIVHYTVRAQGKGGPWRGRNNGPDTARGSEVAARARGSWCRPQPSDLEVLAVTAGPEPRFPPVFLLVCLRWTATACQLTSPAPAPAVGSSGQRGSKLQVFARITVGGSHGDLWCVELATTKFVKCSQCLEEALSLCWKRGHLNFVDKCPNIWILWIVKSTANIRWQLWWSVMWVAGCGCCDTPDISQYLQSLTDFSWHVTLSRLSNSVLSQ